MCTEIYIGTAEGVELTVDDSPSGLWITPLPPGPRIQREFMELESVYEVGSFMGCSCGLMFGEFSKNDPTENHEQRKANVRELREILLRNSEHIVRIMTLVNYNLQFLEEYTRLILDLDSMNEDVTEFSFDADRVYEIWPPGELGPARLSEIFPPVILTKDDIGGTAPEVFNYRGGFVGKTWQEIEQRKYEDHSDAFCLMELNSLAQIIPGLLLAGMNAPGSMLDHSIESFSNSEKYTLFLERLAPQQRLFIERMMNFLNTNE